MNPNQLTTVDDLGEGVEVKASAYLRHLCPHWKDETDEGRVEVSWIVDDKTIELHSLAKYFEGWAKVRISHENLTLQIERDLAEAGVYEITVKTFFTTAGMPIELTARAS